MHESDYTTRICLPHSRCDNFRTCQYCARIRQAKIASAVEKLQEICGSLTWSIVYPHDGSKHAAERAKLEFLKKAKAEGAVWTVEKSNKTNALHLNIITPRLEIDRIKLGNLWQQEIIGNPRNVGAYIAKQSQMPTVEEYDGRLYGTSGNLWQILANAHNVPIVQAAAAQYAIDSHAALKRAAELQLTKTRNPQKTFYVPDEKPEMSKEEARSIAAKWLPDILQGQRDKARK